jgi:hypothetical protein
MRNGIFTRCRSNGYPAARNAPQQLGQRKDEVLGSVLSVIAVVISLASLVVSYYTYRAAGPRVTMVRRSLAIQPFEVYLEVKVINSGLGEIDLDGASCDLLGPTVTVLPYRLKAAASHVIAFRSPPSTAMGRSASVTVYVGLGNGRTLTSVIRLSEIEQADLRRALVDLRAAERGGLKATQAWIPPTQEQV